MATKNKQPNHTRSAADLVPPAVPKADLHKLLFKQSEPEVQAIKDYVEGQCRGEQKVLHAEKVASERVFGREHGVWDVHTDKERWWVITNATNLYSQTLMPSLDYTLSFHIGLMARMAAARTPAASEAQQEFLLATTRKMMQAGEAFDESDEEGIPGGRHAVSGSSLVADPRNHPGRRVGRRREPAENRHFLG